MLHRSSFRQWMAMRCSRFGARNSIELEEGGGRKSLQKMIRLLGERGIAIVEIDLAQATDML
jgi:hypothetical protein